MLSVHLCVLQVILKEEKAQVRVEHVWVIPYKWSPQDLTRLMFTVWRQKSLLCLFVESPWFPHPLWVSQPRACWILSAS